uniref:C2H2-type domain-containing protein n=1 Tax=Dicentrarchus labrax TaxID=13489 RepID=A0A8C4I6G5_DICLA
MYCRYSVTSCQEESSQSNTSKKAPSPERPQGLESAREPSKEVKNAPPPQHPNNEAADSLAMGFNAYACAENLFYCQKCNYGNPSVIGVLSHQAKVHQSINSSRDCIIEHTASVRDQIEKSKSQAKELSFSTHLPLPLMNESDGPRTLHCHRCPYSTQYVYLLRRHMWKIHKANRSVTEVLKVCFKRGTLQTGYHCDLCVFSHKKAAAVYNHYQEQHPGRRPSLQYVTTRLYVGPDATQRSGQNETKMYSCRACSFKGSSKSDIACHYRAVHPWSVKEDGSVLDVLNSKKPGANRQVQDHNEMPLTFDTYQAPLEFENSPGSSHEATASPATFKCVYCPAKFPSQRGLNTHCGMKHQDALAENLDEQQEEQVQTQTRVHVFKCPHCTYVNTNYHGVLTHCQMRHPVLASRADSFYVDEAHVRKWEHCLKRKGHGIRLSGYMCKTCPEIYATLEKLNKHREQGHKGTVANAVANTPQSAPKPSAMSKKKQYKALSNQGTVSKASFLSKKTYAVIKCQYCSYGCSTQLALSRHMHVRHQNASVSKVQDSLYKCALCSSSYFRKKRLGSHYANKHGKEAFLKYCAPLFTQVTPATTVPDRPLTQQPDNNSEDMTTEDNKMLVYRCPCCPYMNASYHGTLTHCQMKHPDIVARADELQTEEVLVTNIVSCTMGKAESEESANVKCKMCQNLTFDSSQLLIDHYSTFHSSDCTLDFIVLSQASKKSTGLYICALCKKQMNGIRKLCDHLDRHREQRKKMAEAAERTPSLAITTAPELCRQDELPIFETVAELAQWNVTPTETFTLPTSPLLSPSKHADLEQPELDPREDEHTCKQCGRKFMSLKGLRSHERSHAALAAIKKMDNVSTSALKHNINKYIIYKAGTIRPFLCSFCSYRTTVMGLWRSHFMKKHHGDGYTETVFFFTLTESYLEPPDVQRQLNHYNLMAQAGAALKVNVQETSLPENSLLHCEVCNFNTGHLSSIRRHYLRTHGKKILRCKDCNFVTGFRKTLEMHIQTGHSTCQSEPTHQKDLRCPFCLYQTKNKNNMIDHIVLHREERVVPIEVRRSKLSRCLQGIVFRCHKCTFTSGSAENLRLHMMRHDDVKPYKCRLCYFDCTRLTDLEAHLSDKHQVRGYS